MSVLMALNIIIAVFLVWIIATQGYFYIQGKRAATYLENDAFKQQMHQAQIVDVREPAAFKRKHILGARNIPFSQMKLYQNALRKDKPVFLYEDNKAMAIRFAVKLKKQGYSELYILKGGLNRWDGKTK